MNKLLFVLCLLVLISACVTIKEVEKKETIIEPSPAVGAEPKEEEVQTEEVVAEEQPTGSYYQEAGGINAEGDVLNIGGGKVDTTNLCPTNTFLTMADCIAYCDAKDGDCEQVPGKNCYGCWVVEDTGCLSGEYATLSECEDAYGNCVRVVGPLSC